MKSAEPAHHAIKDDTAESNEVNHSTEKLCKQMLKDFPNFSGTTDYTDKPKHAHRLDIEVINEAPIRQNLRIWTKQPSGNWG